MKDGTSEQNTEKESPKQKSALHQAVRDCDLPEINELIAKKVDVNAVDEEGMTPLMIAVQGNNYAVVETLIQAKADVNAKDSKGNCVLLYAVAFASDELFDLLVAHQASLEVKNNIGLTLLHVAVMNQKLSLIEKLIALKADVNAEDFSGAAVVHYAAGYGHVEVFKLLQRLGAKLDVRTKMQDTILHIAIANDQKQIIELILDQVDVNAKNVHGETPLHYIATVGANEIFDLLISNKELILNQKNEDGHTPIHIAIAKENITLINKLIDAGLDINEGDDETAFPIHYAVMKGLVDIYNLLVQRGARLDLLEDTGYTFLNLALLKGQILMAKKLILDGMDVNLADKKGNTTLHYAAALGDMDLYDLLISKNAMLEAKNNKDITPLHVAVSKGNIKIVERLIKAGANVNAPSTSGNPLYIAIDNKDRTMFDLLISSGADIDAPAFENNNLSPLLVLTEQNNEFSQEIIELVVNQRMKDLPDTHQSMEQLRFNEKAFIQEIHDAKLIGLGLGFIGKFNCTHRTTAKTFEFDYVNSNFNWVFASINDLVVKFNQALHENTSMSTIVETSIITIDEKKAWQEVTESFNAHAKDKSSTENACPAQARRYFVEGKPVFILCAVTNVGPEGQNHGFAIVFHKNRMYVVDKARASITRFAIKAKSIVTVNQLSQLFWDLSLSLSFNKINEKLFSVFEVEPLEGKETYLIKQQSKPNCSYTNIKHACLGLLLSLKEEEQLTSFIEQDQEPSTSMAEIDCYKVYKLFSSFQRYQLVDNYFAKYQYSPDKWQPLVAFSFEKQKKLETGHDRSIALSKYISQKLAL